MDLHSGDLKLDHKKHSIALVTKLLFFIQRQIEAHQCQGIDSTSTYISWSERITEQLISEMFFAMFDCQQDSA